MLNLASLCFPDAEKSCFFCCPPIRDPEADPLDDVARRKQLLRENRSRLKERLARPREISGRSCWGLGFLDRREKQIGCLLHPLQNKGRDLRHLTGYQFKCANALCREALVFADLKPEVKRFCLDLCRGMDSFAYSSRTNPLMQLLAWEVQLVTLVAGDGKTGRNEKPAENRENFIKNYGFLWQELDFRLDGYLATQVAARRGFNYLRQHRNGVIIMRQRVIARLNDCRLTENQEQKNLKPSHTLEIPLALSRLLKFGAGLWELPPGCEDRIRAVTEDELAAFLGR